MKNPSSTQLADRKMLCIMLCSYALLIEIVRIPPRPEGRGGMRTISMTPIFQEFSMLKILISYYLYIFLVRGVPVKQFHHKYLSKISRKPTITEIEDENNAVLPCENDEELKRIKINYTKYAGELMRLRESVPHFIPLDEVLRHKMCDCASRQNAEISAFPQRTHLFSTLMLIRCTECECAFVPRTTFDLSEYYASQYAKEHQPFRVGPGVFFSPANAFLGTATYNRMRDRARKLLALAGDNADRSVLDYGSGPGILLKESVANLRYAIESDAHAIRTLQNELDVKVISLNNADVKVDTIFASHVLEHLAAEDLIETIVQLRNLLKLKGKMVIAVPDGASHVSRLRRGSRDGIQFEPHTLYFSLKSLIDTLKKCGLTVTCVSSKAKSMTSNPKLYSQKFLSRFNLIDSSELIVVAHI